MHRALIWSNCNTRDLFESVRQFIVIELVSVFVVHWYIFEFVLQYILYHVMYILNTKQSVFQILADASIPIIWIWR